MVSDVSSGSQSLVIQLVPMMLDPCCSLDELLLWCCGQALVDVDVMEVQVNINIS